MKGTRIQATCDESPEIPGIQLTEMKTQDDTAGDAEDRWVMGCKESGRVLPCPAEPGTFVPVAGNREFAIQDERLPRRFALTRNAQTWGRDRVGYRFIKRTFDVIFGACIIAVAFIPSVILCIVIALDSSGCPLYRQKRVGRIGPDGRPREFTMRKYRSMVKGAEKMKDQLLEKNGVQGAMFKTKDGPRVTHVGCYIQKHLMTSVIGTPGDEESTKFLLCFTNTLPDLQLRESCLGFRFTNISFCKPFYFLSLTFSGGVSVLGKNFAEWLCCHLSPFQFGRNYVMGCCDLRPVSKL